MHWTAEVLALLKSINAAWNENNPSKAWRELQDAFCKRWDIRITEEGVETSIQNRIDATETFMVCYGCLEWLLTSDFDSNQPMLAKEHSRFTKLSRSELLENPFINLSGANRLGRRCFHCRLHSEEAKQNGSPWLHKHQFGYILRCRLARKSKKYNNSRSPCPDGRNSTAWVYVLLAMKRRQERLGGLRGPH